MQVPSSFVKAKSYNGFQAHNSESSISMEATYSPLIEFEAEYSKDRMKAMKLELYERRPLMLENNK